MPLTRETLAAWNHAVAVWRRAQSGEQLEPLEYAAAVAAVTLSTLPRCPYSGAQLRTWHYGDCSGAQLTGPGNVAHGL